MITPSNVFLHVFYNMDTTTPGLSFRDVENQQVCRQPYVLGLQVIDAKKKIPKNSDKEHTPTWRYHEIDF
jgi:hypothetical protein